MKKGRRERAKVMPIKLSPKISREANQASCVMMVAIENTGNFFAK